MPRAVRFALWGIPDRSTAVGFLLLALALAGGSAAGAFVTENPWYVFGVTFIAAARGYVRAIAWMDRQGAW